MGNDGRASLLLTHPAKKEIDHPNPPDDVKREAQEMSYTIPVALTAQEDAQKARVSAVFVGEGNPERYAADALHIFEVGKYGGYFVTTDKRILRRKNELANASGASHRDFLRMAQAL